MIRKINEVRFDKIYIDNFVETTGGNYTVAKLYFSNNNDIESILIQSSSMPIYKFYNDNVILKTTDDFKNMCDRLDNYVISFIQNNMNLKQYRYKTLVNTLHNIDVISLKLNNKSIKPLFFLSSDKEKNPESYENAKQYFKKITKIKFIFEIDGIIIDHSKKTIIINIMAKQVLLYLPKPKKTLLPDKCLFNEDINSEVCDNINDEDIKQNLNIDTEYITETEYNRQDIRNSETSLMCDS